ncbi:MAG: response regulator [Sedimentisphaerales bacterium]|nr:response regulator [Sedimentisphaerales bacterium]
MDKRTILFVDDEEKVLKSLRRGLLDEHYDMLFATSGKEALRILEENEVHIIVTDMRMPEMSGLELLRVVKEKYPRIVRIALSGYTWVATLLKAINEGEIYKFITKPWNLDENLISVLREAVEFYNQQTAQDALLEEANTIQE